LSGVGRLKPGVSIAQAQGDLLRIHKAMIAEGHKNNEIRLPRALASSCSSASPRRLSPQ
jgi:hypothetical protein